MPKGTKSKAELPTRQRRAMFVPSTANDAERTIEIVWTTGAEGERFEWDGEVYLESLRVDDKSVRLGRLNSGAAILNTHKSERLEDQIGVVESAWIADGQGHALVRFSTAPEVDSIWLNVKTGIYRNNSVGYVVHHYDRVLGVDGEPDRLIATDWEPLEISFVPVPFDAGAQVRGGALPRTFTAKVTNPQKGKHRMARSIKQIRTALKAARAALVKAREVEDETKIAEAQEALDEVASELESALDTLDEGAGDAEDGEDGEGQPNAPPSPDARGSDGTEDEAEQRGAIAERHRSNAIRSFATKHSIEPKVTESMISRGLSVDSAKLLILETLASRQHSVNPNVGPNMANENIAKAQRNIQAAILHRAAPSKHKLPEEARDYRGMSMIDLARECITMAGGNTRGLDRSEVARLAMNVSGRGQQRAAGMHSTSDFPLILGNTINRSLRAAYDEIPQNWLPLGRQNNFSDFRERVTVALGEAARLERVREGGEYKYGSLPEEGSKMRAEKWGKIIAYTWEMMVNDDLGAFDRVPQALARSARETESDVVWKLFTTNAKWSDGQTIFSSGHGNLGTAAPLNITTLQAARQALRTQKGIDGKTFLNIEPRYLVVGPLNEMAAYQYTSTNYVPVSNATINPTYNTNLIPIVDPRITDYSWFLVGDRYDTIEYGYLDGEGGMVTDTRDGFEVDGVEVKARLVFGAGWSDYRAVYKNPGAAS